MKAIDTCRARYRILLEPGLPPLLQSAGSGEGWQSALRLPALRALTNACSGTKAVDQPLGDLLEEGEVSIFVDTQGSWPSAMQLMNFSWLEHEDEALAKASLEALCTFVPTLRATYDFLPDEYADRLPPRLAEPNDLLPLIALQSITIHAIDHASTPYLGLQFSCAWDEEHGLGLLCHGTEVLDIGTAEAALDRSRAQAHRDAVLKRLAVG